MVGRLCDETETAGPSLPRKRKAPKRYEVGEAEGYHSPTVEEQYRRYYFEAIDLVTHAIDERFDQPGYATIEILKNWFSRQRMVTAMRLSLKRSLLSMGVI